MFKEEKIKAIIGILPEFLRLKMLTPKEAEFAEGLISFYKVRGFLSEGQIDRGWKFWIRIAKERDPFKNI